MAGAQHARRVRKRKMGLCPRVLSLFWEKLEMQKACKGNAGIKQLVSYYRDQFRIPENLNHYSARDYKIAEKKFLKYVVLGQGAGAQRDVS